MKKLLGIVTAAVTALSTPVWADGSYHLFGSHGDKWGELTFEKTVGEYTVWVWPNAEGQVNYYIKNPTGGSDGWNNGPYDGYFTVDMPEDMTTPCRYAINDAEGFRSDVWGAARMHWTSSDEFNLKRWVCNSSNIDIEVNGRYAWDQSNAVTPVAVRLILQSDHIPLSYEDPAYTDQGLDKNPAIHLEVDFSDGSSLAHDYKKFSASNIIFDDVSGDPDDIIQINYWDVDPNNPSLGKYAAQLTSTGKGTGTAELIVSFRDAPHVTASVTATVVSAARHFEIPMSASLELNGYTLPINRWDRAHTVSNLNVTPAIFVTTKFQDGSTVAYQYHKDFAENVVIDAVSGDPQDLIRIVDWPVDNNKPNGKMYAGQIQATGRGIGTAYLTLSFKNAPGVTASIAVSVVSGTQ